MTPRSLARVGLLTLAAAVGCDRLGSQSAPAPVPVANDAPVAVTVAVPKRKSIAWSVEQPGTIQAFESTPLVAKLAGYVKTIVKDLGDPVEAGEVLATLDIPELECEADQKKAAVAEAAAAVEQAKKSVDVAAAGVTAAQANETEAKAGLARVQADYERWESELKRVEGLVGSKVIDRQTLDETTKQFRSAAAAKEEVNAKVQSANAAVKEAQARKGRAEADQRAAEARVALADADAKRVAALLAYREIKAPYKGVVTGRFVHTGHFLQPTAGGRGEPLFTVARLDIVRVFVDVPESAAPHAVAGAKAVVRLPAVGGKEFNGAVTRTAGVLNPDTRTLRTEIDLPNPDGALRPGQYAVVRIAATTKDAAVVPAAAVLFADETAYCFAVENGKAVKLRVQVGRADGDGYELLAKRRANLTAGDWQPIAGTEQIVVGNLGALTDGQTVTVKESK